MRRIGTCCARRMISADTSVLVRYLVGTPRAQARAAARLIDSEREIGVSPVALAECAQVLRTQVQQTLEPSLAELIQVLHNLLLREAVHDDDDDKLRQVRAVVCRGAGSSRSRRDCYNKQDAEDRTDPQEHGPECMASGVSPLP